MNIASRIIRKLARLSYIPWDGYVLLRNRIEHGLFSEAVRDFSEHYQALKKYDFSAYVTPHWERMNARLEKRLVHGLPFSFLRDPTISYTMFVSGGGKVLLDERRYLETQFGKEQLRALLSENAAGIPLILDRRYVTSHNSIRHLFSIARWIETVKPDMSSIKTVVEWGGGYGNMAKIFLRLIPGIQTYVIIDTPLFSLIQRVYLSVVLGAGRVHFISGPEDKIEEGKVNILPVAFVESLSIRADLFVSTWALSESNAYAQCRVIERECFGAKHLLVAYQEANSLLPESEGVLEMVRRFGAQTVAIPHLRGAHYIFK